MLPCCAILKGGVKLSTKISGVLSTHISIIIQKKGFCHWMMWNLNPHFPSGNMSRRHQLLEGRQWGNVAVHLPQSASWHTEVAKRVATCAIVAATNPTHVAIRSKCVVLFYVVNDKMFHVILWSFQCHGNKVMLPPLSLGGFLDLAVLVMLATSNSARHFR